MAPPATAVENVHMGPKLLTVAMIKRPVGLPSRSGVGSSRPLPSKVAAAAGSAPPVGCCRWHECWNPSPNANNHLTTDHHDRVANMATSHAQNLPQELLLRIFMLLDRRSNARNARVCKAWREGALDEVWRELHDWTRVLASLAAADTYRDPVIGKWVGYIFDNASRTSLTN